MYIQKKPPLPFVQCIWHAKAEQDGVYTDPANEYWGLGFIKRTDGSFGAELYGPSLQPRTLDGHAGDEYWGLEFAAYVILKIADKHDLLNTHTSLPVSGTYFSLGSHQYQIPTYSGLEGFAQQLLRGGSIVADQRICRALQGDDAGFSERSRQRHFKNVTGITKKQAQQLERARHAFYLLQTEHSLPQAAAIAGYSDQSHMTRSLKLLRGETPAQIIVSHLAQS